MKSFPFKRDAYFSLFEKMHESVYIVEALRNESGEIVDLLIKYANPTSEAYFGVFREKSVGKTLSSLHDPEIIKSYIGIINEISVTGEGRKHEIYYPKMDKYFLTSFFSLQDNLYVIISSDITEHEKTIEGLKEKEDLLRSIFKTFPGVIWVYDLLEQENVYICREIYELIGYTKKEAHEKKRSFWEGLYHPEDREKVNKFLEKIKNARNGEIVEIEYRLRHKDGKWHWFDAKHVVLKRTPEGTPWQFLGTVEDITPRKKAEELLRFSERTFRTLAENSPDIIIRFNNKLHITYVNPIYPYLIGKTRKECIGKTFRKLGMPYKLTLSSEKLLKTVFETEGPEALEFKLPTVEGLKYYSARLIPEFERSSVETVLFVAHDISDVIQAEEEIQRLADIVESSDDAIIGKTVDGIIFSWNRGAEKIYGYKADEIIGKHISILMSPEEWEKTSKLMEKIKEGETVTHFEAKRLRKDGTELDASLTLSPIKNVAGEITGISTVAKDITER